MRARKLLEAICLISCVSELSRDGASLHGYEVRERHCRVRRVCGEDELEVRRGGRKCLAHREAFVSTAASVVAGVCRGKPVGNPDAPHTRSGGSNGTGRTDSQPLKLSIQQPNSLREGRVSAGASQSFPVVPSNPTSSGTSDCGARPSQSP